MGLSDLLKLLGADVGGPQFIPSLLASVIGVWVVPSLTSDPLEAAASLSALKTTDKLGLAVAIAIVLALAFRILGLIQLRFYEGYLGPRGLRKRLSRRQMAKSTTLRDERRALIAKDSRARTPEDRRRLIQLSVILETRHAREEHLVLPTRLGNAFRALEGYPNDRYGFDGVAMWPRIEPLLSEEVRKNVDRARGAVDLLLTATTLSGLYAVTGVALRPLNYGAWLVGLTLGLFSYALYRTAVVAVVGLRSATAAAFDVGRSDLVKIFGYEIPSSPSDEKALLDELTGFVLYGEPLQRARGIGPRDANKDSA